MTRPEFWKDNSGNGLENGVEKKVLQMDTVPEGAIRGGSEDAAGASWAGAAAGGGGGMGSCRGILHAQGTTRSSQLKGLTSMTSWKRLCFKSNRNKGEVDLLCFLFNVFFFFSSLDGRGERN